MAAPTVNSVGAVFGTPGGAATTAAYSAPATIGVDDILVLISLTNSTTTLSGLPSGWAHVTGSPNSSTGGTNATLNVCWKRAVAGDVGAVSYTFTLSASDYAEGAILAVRGAINSGSPWDTGAGAPTFAHTGTNSGTAPAVSLTTQGADRLLINGALNQTGAAGWTASSGFTKDFEKATGGAFGTCTGYHVAQAVAGATGNVQPVCPSSGQMVNFLGALLPTGGATAVFVPPVRQRRRQPPVRVRPARTVVPPAQVFVAQPRRRRPTPTLVRRGRCAQVVPPQVVVVPPPKPPQFIREKTRWFASRRGKVAQVVPPQVVAPPPVYVPPAVRSRGRFLPQRRPRVAVTPPPQVQPPSVARIRLRLPIVRHGRAAEVVPAQVVVPAPPYRPRSVAQKLRQLVFRRPRFVGSGWMVGAAAPTCDTPRPSTGTTARPGSGMTAYSTSMTARPSTGTTAPPNTGTTDNPC